MPDYYKERIQRIAQEWDTMSDSVELGLFLHVLVNAKHEDWKTVQRLINLQEDDWGFQASSELLVPRPDVGHEELHELQYHTKTMSDTDRTLSTSSAIVGLYRYLQYLESILEKD